MSKFIVPLSLADFIESPANVFSQGFVGLYIKSSEVKLMKDGIERDLVLDRKLEQMRSDDPVAPVFADDTIQDAIIKLQNSISSLTLTGDVEGTAEYKDGKLQIKTAIQGAFVDLKWTFVQSAPSMVWIIDHPFDKHPAVTLLNSAKEKIEGAEEYPFVGRVIVKFTSAIIGSAELS